LIPNSMAERDFAATLRSEGGELGILSDPGMFEPALGKRHGLGSLHRTSDRPRR
jgi:hypothetical protein